MDADNTPAWSDADNREGIVSTCAEVTAEHVQWYFRVLLYEVFTDYVLGEME